MKIIKTKSSSWQGSGFGTHGATYAVQNNPLIRIIRAPNGWYAYIGTNKLFGVNKLDLEAELSKI
jgi:hypothetical protein